MKLGLGCLCAVALGYNYSFSKIELVSNLQKKFKSWEVKLGWGLDGCARWGKVTIQVTIKQELGSNFQKNLKQVVE